MHPCRVLCRLSRKSLFGIRNMFGSHIWQDTAACFVYFSTPTHRNNELTKSIIVAANIDNIRVFHPIYTKITVGFILRVYWNNLIQAYAIRALHLSLASQVVLCFNHTKELEDIAYYYDAYLHNNNKSCTQ